MMDVQPFEICDFLFLYSLEGCEGYLPVTCSCSRCRTVNEEELTLAKKCKKQTRELCGSLVAIFVVAWGQCSEAMCTKWKTLDDFSTEHAANNCTPWLPPALRI
jgi:hypothetical protein